VDALSPQHLVTHARNIALDAGRAILAISQGPLSIDRKADQSPVTVADQTANTLIVRELRRLTPTTTIVSEEGEHSLEHPDSPFWLVDPLDGTREFIAENGEYTVNIALIQHRTPTLGVIHAPAIGRTFYSYGPGKAFEYIEGTEAPLRARPPSRDGIVAVASRSHLDPESEAYLAAKPITKTTHIGSSLKFCLIAAGEADLYPRFGPTMEWDTAAGHAILLAAGGSVTGPDGAPLLYAKAGFRNTSFIASGAPTLA